jgi:murein DD-endopeptidase MepM/ murein hydrolase activator NlpD
MTGSRIVGLLILAVIINSATEGTEGMAKVSRNDRGHGTTETGLVPAYPEDYECSPLTSLYASWIDVDGSRRSERHSGVDGGRLGDAILAPAAGIIKAAWKANWGWGEEGALLIRHSREDLGLRNGPRYYYSELDHLSYADVEAFTPGDSITRGQRLATVTTPGGKARYLPEVHWEVWEIDDDQATQWGLNKHGAQYWTNPTGRLIDPLYMLSRNVPPDDAGKVAIPVFDGGRDYRKFRGFTYILPCIKRRGAR